jgi:uncharacterized protein DUF4388
LSRRFAQGILCDDVDDDLKARLGQGPGAWKLLDTEADLLVALRDQGGGLLAELKNVLHPDRAVLAGDLAEMQPSDLLNFLHQGRRTGVLLTRSLGVERAIVLVEGNIAWACSTSPGEAPGDRWRGPRQQVVEIFLGQLVSRSGSFVFLRGLERSGLASSLSLDTQAMLLDGLRRLDEMERYRTLVPHPDVTPRRTGKAVDRRVTVHGRQVFALADGSRTVAEVALRTALGEFETTKAAYALIEGGYLKL